MCISKKVHTLAYAYKFCTAAGNICEKVHTYTDSLSYRFCAYLYPLFFLFFFKKVHTLAGHYKCGPHLQKVHTYMYTLKQQAAAGSIYKKVYTYICIQKP